MRARRNKQSSTHKGDMPVLTVDASGKATKAVVASCCHTGRRVAVRSRARATIWINVDVESVVARR